MKNTWLISTGHGNNTAGKRKKFSDGLEIFEYSINRIIGELLMWRLDKAGITYIRINPEHQDVSNTQRVARANKIAKTTPNCIYLSIHNNAVESEQANGFEWFTTRGKTNSDAIATIFHKHQKAAFPELTDRGIKEANYTELTGTMKSVLGELAFFTNRKEAELLLSDEGQERFADCLFAAILEIESM